MRVGICGALQPDMHLYDVVVVGRHAPNSAFVEQYQLPVRMHPLDSFRLIEEVVHRAREASVLVHVERIMSADVFYSTQTRPSTRPERAGHPRRRDGDRGSVLRRPPTRASKGLVIFTVSDSRSRAR